MVAVRKLSIAIDAFRLISEPLTSGAIYASELTQALAELPEVGELYLLVPSEPQEDFLYKALLEIKKIKFIYPDVQLFPAQSFNAQLHWIQVEIPHLVRGLDTRPDFYIAPYHHPPILLPRGIRIATIIHDLCGLGIGFPKTKKAFYHHLSMLILASIRSNRLIPISEFTKIKLRTSFPYATNRITDVVHNTVTTQPIDCEVSRQICQKYGLEEMKYFLSFGMPGVHKGFDVILDSYRRYKNQGGELPLVLIVTSRYRSDVENLVNAYGLNDVLMVFDIDFSERDALYRCALALLFLSRCEGFGYPVVEAMRQGCPPIAWKNTPARETIGDTAPLLESLDPIEAVELMCAYENLTMQEREMIANKLADRSLLFDGAEFGRKFLNAMTGGWQR